MQSKFISQVFNSILHTPEIEADAERFLHLYPKFVEIGGLEKFSFWGELVQYCTSPFFIRPKLTIPIVTPIFPIADKGNVSYQKIFLAGSVTFTRLKDFEM